MNTPKLLSVVIGLQVLSLATQFLGQPTLVSPAMAQMPDAGAQRAQMIDELRGIRADMKALATATSATNARVEKISTLLDSGRLQVLSATPDDNRKPTTVK